MQIQQWLSVSSIALSALAEGCSTQHGGFAIDSEPAVYVPIDPSAVMPGQADQPPIDPSSDKGTTPTMLSLINAARAQDRYCGSKHFDAAGPLTWSDQLTGISLLHSLDMAKSGKMSHTGSDGSGPGDRAKAGGYRFSQLGENVAAGHTSIPHVVAGWIASPGHCENIMNPDVNEMGASYARGFFPEFNDKALFWTQMFGKRMP